MLNNGDFSSLPRMTSAHEEHGIAALLLVESLIHGLREKSALTGEQTASIVQTAIDVQLDLIDAAQGDAAPMWRSHNLLLAIAASLEIDSQGRSSPVRLV